jgi:hypothetical protein
MEMTRVELQDQLIFALVHERLSTLADGLAQGVVASLKRFPKARWGTLISPDRHGNMKIRNDFLPGTADEVMTDTQLAFLYFYADDLRLTEQTAARLRSELQDVIRRYRSIEQHGKRFALAIAFTANDS